MPSPSSTSLPKIKIPRNGNLNLLQRILGLHQDDDSLCSVDAVFVSIDLEVSGTETRERLCVSDEKPIVREYGVALLDSRLLLRETEGNGGGRTVGIEELIETMHYRDRKAATRKSRRKCVFAETKLVHQSQFPSIIRESLRIQDTSSSSPPSCKPKLQNIIIIGHSPKSDLRILQRLGIDFFTISPLLGIIDTHSMARYLLQEQKIGGEWKRGRGREVKPLSLGGVMRELGVRDEEEKGGWGLHNAGNDAVYTVWVMLLLGVRSYQLRRLSEGEGERLRVLERLVRGLVKG